MDMPRLRPCSWVLVLVLAGACAGPSASEQTQTRAGEGAAARSEDAEADPVARELERMWAEAGVEPSPLASDAAFIRRASLDLVGRVPTQAEVETFLASDAPDKRAALVDDLLASEAHAERWAGLWTAELLPGDRKARRIAGEALESYLFGALADNRSWSAVAEDLLAAEGMVEDDPALAYLGARKLRGPRREDAVAELSSTTARVFLGAQIECAQCHDHPYAPEFSREDFWAQAAYFGRTVVRFDREALKQAKAQAKGKRAKMAPPKVEVHERRKGELRVALDGDDAVVIAPRFLGAEASASAEGETRRAALARSIIADPRFAEATVGWVWNQLLGAGIVEPWDGLLAARERPALLTALAEEFRASDHDQRALIRRIVLSPAYQRASSGPAKLDTHEIAAAEAVFARAAVRPLDAEQLFASLLTVTAIEEVGGRAFRRAVRGKIETALREYEFVFADDEMGAGDGFSGNVPQALLLLNGGLTNEGVVARPGSGLERILADSAETDARLEDLWLMIYARHPRPEELALGRETIARDGTRAWEDLMFAMIYSSEFGSNH